MEILRAGLGGASPELGRRIMFERFRKDAAGDLGVVWGRVFLSKAD
jgi:hypothetical protein